MALTAEELAGVTKLTLTGAIDARDFKTMRDEMPLLAELDISGATISAYSGTGGTSQLGNSIYPADAIPESAFLYSNWEGKNYLTTVKLPSSLNSIGQRAFYSCQGLTTIVIPASVTIINDGAFGWGPVLFTVDAANQYYSSIDGVLFNKSKTILIQCPPSKSGSYTIPSSVTTIGLDAFAKCSLLTSINISTSVQSINNGAFIYCYGLISLSIPSSVTFIQSYALSCGNGLTSIYLTRSFPVDLSTSDGVFFNVNKNSCTLYVPYGSKSAYQSANQWKDFTNIVETPGFKLSASSARVGASQGSILNTHISSDVTWTASSNQTWLSVNPSSGTGLEKVFTSTAQANPSILSRTAIVTISATGVESQTLTITQDGSNALLNVTAGGLASALTSAELAGVTKLTLTGTIDARDFKTLRDEMPLLAELDLSGVTVVAYIGTLGTSSTSNMFYPANTVPDYAFVKSATWEGKASLTSVILPSSITSIGYVAFAYCSGLTGTFTIPFSVSSIGAYAFYVCQGLTSIVIPSTVTSIGTRAFSSCSGLTSLYSNTLIPASLSTSTNVFLYINKTTCVLNVPYGSKAAYQAASQWKDFTNIVEIPGLYVSSTTATLAGNEGSSTSVNIYSSTVWAAVSNQTWLTVASETGNSSGVLTFTGSANNGLVSRTASVTVSASGFDSKIVTVTQNPVILEGNIKILSLFKPQILSNGRAFCDLSNNEPIIVKILNDGTVPVSNFDVEYWVNGNKIARETYGGTVNPGDTLTFTFASKYNFLFNGYFNSVSLELKIIRPENNMADNILKRTLKEFGNYTDLPNWTTLNSCDGMLSDISWAIAEDKNGDIWSTDFYGASKFDGTKWTTYTTANGLGDNYNWAMINDRDGNIWFTGATSSVITKFDGSTLIQYPQSGKFDECIYEDSKGNIWFGSYIGDGVLKYDGTNWVHYEAATHSLGDYVLSIGEDKNGNMFFGTSNGVIKFDGLEWNNFVLPGDNSYVSEIFFDSKGNSWFTSGSNFIKYNAESFVQYTLAEGTIGSCEDITEDKYGNLWFGGDNEVVKYDGETWTKYAPSNGMAAVSAGKVFALHADKNGDILIGTNGGGISKFLQSNTFPKHFQTVWTGYGFDHMNINIYSAKLDGIELQAGDEIGIFDGTSCVGAGFLTKILSSTNILSIAVSRNDGSGNGYTSGNPITYKLYDASLALENSSVSAIYSNEDPSWSTDGMFTIGVSAFTALNGLTKVTQNIALNTGWNIISSQVIPSNLDMKTIFQTLINAGKLKKVMDETGKTVENFGAFGGWKNNIGNLTATKGYRVNVTAASTLSLEGIPVQLPLDIALNTGWNIISYPNGSTQDAKALFQTLIDAGKIKKVMDETGKTIENFGAFGGWKNNIGNFTTGKGYRVNVTANCTLTIPASGTRSAIVLPELLASEHFKPVFIGNGTDHFNIHLIDLQASGLISGDEIGIFDGELCVGSAAVGTDQLMAGSISIAASANDELGMEANGFTPGNSINLRIYRNNREYRLNPEILNNSPGTFIKGESLFARVNAELATSLEELTGQVSVKCYPNPFSERLTIELQFQQSQKLDVKIYDLSGKLVRNLYQGEAEIFMMLIWNGKNEQGASVAPGSYFLKTNGVEKIVVKN